MCGICGVAGGEPAEGRELVGRMCAAMAHRGPDDDGSIHRDGVTFGMRRLSIIDVEGGHQPIHNEDSKVWVVQNGEIYNHLELRKVLAAAGHSFTSQSDTEVLVHGYEEWGEALVERLNGMFAFAVLDLRRGRVLLARDRMGIKPLHYAVDGRRLVFASEIKALLCDPALRRELDPIALDEYLALEYVPSPRSIVRGISKLPAAHTLEWWLGSGIHRLHRYWSPTLGEDVPAGRRREELLGRICRALIRRIASCAPGGEASRHRPSRAHSRAVDAARPHPQAPASARRAARRRLHHPHIPAVGIHARPCQGRPGRRRGR